MESVREEFDYAAFGARLKEAREKAGFTQAQACEAVGLPKAQVLSSYERGVSNPPLDVLTALALLYGATTDSLLFDAEAAPKGEMTARDWMSILVQAADELHIGIDEARNVTADSAKYYTTGLLTWGPGSVYCSFLSKWVKLRAALKDGLIDENDYRHLITRHLEQIEEHPDYEGAMLQLKKRLGL